MKKKDTFLHVDFQPGNIITSPKGEYVIDIGLMSYGNPIYDYAIWYLFSNMGLTDKRANTFFHITASQTKKCWDLYVKHQFGNLDIEKKTELENYLMAVSLLTFTSHLTSIPVFDVHKEMRDNYFELAYRKYM